MLQVCTSTPPSIFQRAADLTVKAVKLPISINVNTKRDLSKMALQIWKTDKNGSDPLIKMALIHWYPQISTDSISGGLVISKNSPATHDPIIKNPGESTRIRSRCKGGLLLQIFGPGLRLALMAKTIANILTYHNLYIYIIMCVYIYIYIYIHIYIYIVCVCVCTCGKTVIIL